VVTIILFVNIRGTLLMVLKFLGFNNHRLQSETKF